MKIFGAILIGLGLLGWCGAGETAPVAERVPLRIRIILPDRPQARFAGFYIAQDMGYFRQAGCEVELVHQETTQAMPEKLNPGELSVGSLANSLSLVRRGASLVNCGQFMQAPALRFVAWRSGNIKGLKDLNGARLALWNDDRQLAARAYLKRAGVTPEIVPQIGGVELFLRNAVDGVGVTTYLELQQLWSAGFDPEELVVIYPANEPNALVPEDGLYAEAGFYRAHAAQIDKLRDAVMNGWRQAVKLPRRALVAVRNRCPAARTSFSWAAQERQLAEMEKLLFPGGVTTRGILQKRDFEVALELLHEVEPEVVHEPVWADFAPQAVADKEVAQ